MLHAYPGFLESDDFVPSIHVASMESASLEAPGGSGVGVLSGYAFYMRRPSRFSHIPNFSPRVNLEGTSAPWAYICYLEIPGYRWARRTAVLAFASKHNEIMMLLHDTMHYSDSIIHQYHIHDPTI
jgi:hypothetical protein